MRADDVASSLSLTLDAESLYLRLAAIPDLWSLGAPRATIYLASPRIQESTPFRASAAGGASPGLIGFPATYRLDLELRRPSPASSWSSVRGGEWVPTPYGAEIRTAAGVDDVEVAIPLILLGDIEPGDQLRLLAVISDGQRTLQEIPVDGPASLQVPDLGLAELVLRVEDPEGDDTGPGGYSYPTDPVFEPQVFDLRAFSVAVDERALVFTFELFGPLTNPWGSPNGLALQTLDVYVDTDPGQFTGSRLLLPGRNAALAEGFGWEAAIWAEGWTPQFLRPDESGAAVQDGQVSFKIICDPAGRRVSLRVPREAFGDGDPTRWAYAAVVLSQDGFPSPGVWRVRDVEPEAKQWRLGGGPEAANHPRIVDVAWPAQAETTQQELLSGFQPSAVSPDNLTLEDFAQLRMVRP